jgi:primosomal protein N' (replication factor Y)
MNLVDVIFPLALGPLTYEVPPELRGAVRPGALVEAEVKKSVRRGVVLKPSPFPPGAALKPLRGLVGESPVLSGPMLSLVTWMSEYYFASEGEVLKSIFPREFFQGVKARASKKADEVLEIKSPTSPYGPDKNVIEALEDVRNSIEEQKYRTYLHHAPSTNQELMFLLEALEGAGSAIVLAPDLERVRVLKKLLDERFGERVVHYSSGMSRGKRSEAIDRVTTGKADIVIGSRSAVFAPLKEVSLIAVTQEESTAYKEERGVRYGARDIAVMRGYLEGATVLLSSICPSVESFHNAEKGKYRMFVSPRQGEPPAVRVLRRRGLGHITRKAREMAESRIRRGERVMFVANRLGYSMLRCEDCGHMEECPSCGIPLMHYKREKALRCNYCGRRSPLPEKCPGCGGHGLGPSGAGIERIGEELGSFHPSELKSGKGSALKVLMDDSRKLVLGTKVLAKRAGLDRPFSLAVVLNADTYLYMPDFRSAERAFREMVYTAEKLRPGGQLLVQTRNPRAPLFRYLRMFNFRRFYAEELAAREALGYPPFSKMVLITVDGDKEPRTKSQKDVEVLGPVRSLSKRGKKVWKLLLKSNDRQAMRSTVLAAVKGLRGRKVSVDVDPVSV